MDDLFPITLNILEKTSGNISFWMGNLFNYGAKLTLTDDQWNEYGDALERLHTHLGQLELVMNCEYTFSTDMQETANDVLTYTGLLLKHREPLGELAGFLLSQVEFEDAFVTRHSGTFLQDVLYNIISNCTIINRLIEPET